METVRVAVMLLLCACVLCLGQRSRDESAVASALGLVDDVLDEFLDEGNRALSVEKKASVIPRCDVGERCALKHGPRIGRLCDCLRGAACNSFFLRCY
ncbi:unnamed protein product [Knipowitschia caucasica]|uniref:Cocaine- and amphetamine-regulated transcript protein n=1 Tax=Knipowitschia caucasica TaxID=637954 RepID=A0AAV2K4N5_KNICA